NGGGSRKMDWYQNPDLSPNFARLAKEGFVYEESHNDTVSDHGRGGAELLTGRPHTSSSVQHPISIDYLRQPDQDAPSNYWFLKGRPRVPGDAMTDDARLFKAVPTILSQYRPRLIICHQSSHDAGHGNGGYPRRVSGEEEYLDVCRRTDEHLGRIV